MTNLVCDVTNCLHNCSNLCELGEIAVKGESAHVKDGTCCSTFCDTCGSLQKEHVDNAEPQSEIRCSATNCTHNNGCHCCADEIKVRGDGADQPTNTACSTFSCK